MRPAVTKAVANSTQVDRSPDENPEPGAGVDAIATAHPVELLREPFPGDATREIVLLRATFLPGDSTCPHRHPGPLVGFVLTGELEFQLKGQSVQRLAAGDRFFEPPQSAHVVSRNPGKNITQVLAFIVQEKGLPAMIPLNDSEGGKSPSLNDK